MDGCEKLETDESVNLVVNGEDDSISSCKDTFIDVGKFLETKISSRDFDPSLGLHPREENSGKRSVEKLESDSSTTRLMVNKRKMGPRKKIVQSENTCNVERSGTGQILELVTPSQKLPSRKRITTDHGAEPVKRETKPTKKLTKTKRKVVLKTSRQRSGLTKENIRDGDENVTLAKRKRVYKTRTPKKEKKLFVCSVCSKTFKFSTKLKQHMMVHTDHRPFECATCSGRFRSKADLCRHTRIHTRETPYGCGDCEKRFTQRAHLVRHIRTHTLEVPYECGYCGRRFSDNSHLTIHKRLHTGSRPYQCDGCDKNFISSSNLQIHRRSHTLEKSYVCPLCGRCFSTGGSLVRHKRTHTQEKPYQCEFCAKRFCDSSNLRVHRFIHTRRLEKFDVSEKPAAT